MSIDHHVTLMRIFSKYIRIGLEIVVEILTLLRSWSKWRVFPT